MTRPVHVVGGGFAGAAAAARLADAGLPVILWEARPVPGGRAGGFADRASGEVLDTGPHLLMACYRRTRDLLGRLGTHDRLAFQPRLRVPLRVAGSDGGLACPPLPGPLALALGLLTLRPLPWGDRLGLLRAGPALGRPGPAGGTVADWLTATAMPPGAVRLLWGPLCRAVMNLPPEEADGTVFAAALRNALLGPAEGARLGWAREGLASLLGDALGKYLAAGGGEVRRARVAGVILDPASGRVTGLATADGEATPARRVVLAVDAFAAPGLLPPDPRLKPLAECLAALRPAAMVSTYLWLDRPAVPLPPDTPFAGLVEDGPGDTDGSAAEWVFDRDRMAGRAPTDGGQRLATVAGDAGAFLDLPPEAVTERVRAVLARHYPEMARARVLRSRVLKERHATVRITPATDRPAPGAVPGVSGLFLCGDYTDTGFPATIEGAVRSGEAAADAVLSARAGA